MIHNMIPHILCRDSEVISGSLPLQEPSPKSTEIADDKAPVTPDEPKPDVPAAELKPDEGKPVEKITDKELAFQEKYQRIIAYIGQTEPDRVEEFKQAGKTDTASLQTQKSEGQVAVEGKKTLGEMTPEEFSAALAQSNKTSIRESIAEVRNEEIIQREHAQADADVRAFAIDKGLDQAELNEIVRQSMMLGIDTSKPLGWSRLSVIVADKIKLKAVEKGLTQRDQETATTASDQARAMAAVTQPAKGAPATPVEKTKEQKTLAAIHAVKGKSSSDLLDSNRQK